MKSLSQSDLLLARETARNLARGDGLAQSGLDTLRANWEPRVDPPPAERAEQFAIVSPAGVPTGVIGPRWMFHVFGLRHRAIEIGLATSSGLIALQRRSLTKAEWPGALDMAVSGHVSQARDGSNSTFEEAAWKEMAEEIGLERSEASVSLIEGILTAVGRPYYCFEGDPKRNPPFLDAEVRQVYAATLSPSGLAGLRFADDEVDGIFLASVGAAWQILRDGDIASGLRYSLPRYLDWLEQGTDAV